MSSFLENTQDANRDAASRLITNSKSNQSDALELVALQALVRDNLSDGAGGDLPTVTTSSGTTKDVNFDFKTQNLINHDLYSSQVHIIHSTYIDGSAQAQFVDCSSGVQDLSQIELTSATSTYVAGKLKLNITNGPDDISLSNVDGTKKHEISFTSDVSGIKSFTKALLTESEQDNNNATLINVKEDSSNLNLLDVDVAGIVDENGDALEAIGNISNLFDISMVRRVGTNGVTVQTLGTGAEVTFTNNLVASSKPWQIVPGVYRIQSFAESGLDVEIVSTVVNDVSSLSITDICGRHVLDADGYTPSQAGALIDFLPTPGVGQVAESYKDNAEVEGYNFTIDLSAAGSYTIDANNSAGQARLEFVNTQDTCGNIAYMRALRNFGSNKDASLNNGSTVVPDVLSHSVSIVNSVVDLSFNNVNDVSFTNGAGKFKVDISSTMDEFLTDLSQGEIKLYKRDDTERLAFMNKNDVSNVILGTKVAYPGETGLAQGTETATHLLSEGDAKNLAEVADVKYSVVSRFPNPGSALLDSVTVSGGNQTYAFAYKDASSILFNDLSINVDLCATTIATLQSNSVGVTLIRLEDNNVFATRENRLVDLDAKGVTDISYSNPDVQIYVDGRNVDLSLGGVYNYDQVRMLIEPKKLEDDLSGLQVDGSHNGFNPTSAMNNGQGLSFSLDSNNTHVKTQINNNSRLNDLVWDIIDADAASSGAKLDVSFDVIPSYAGDVSAHEFQSKVQTQVHIQWADVNGSLQNIYLYPEDYNMTTLTSVDVSQSVLYYDVAETKRKVSKHTSTKQVSISDPFKFGAYANLNIDFSGVEIKDTFFEYYYENGTKAPEGRLRSLANQHEYAAKREITFNNSKGTTGPEKRTLGLDEVKTLTLQLQGRDKDDGVTFSTNETKHGLDVAFNQRTTINSFNGTPATFNIDIDLDPVNDLSLNATGYEIVLDFGEGNGIWNLKKKTGPTLADVMTDINFGPNVTLSGGLQSIFNAPGFGDDNQLSTVHTIHTVNDNTGFNTLEVKNGTDVLATFTADKTLLANLILVVGDGPVFEITRTTGTNNEDMSSNIMKYTDTSYVMLDDGIRLDICENLVQFNNPEASFNLLPDKMFVEHVDSVGDSSLNIGTQNGGSLKFSNSLAQDIHVNAYRGIVEDQTIQIHRTLGSYSMDFSGNSTVSQDLLADKELDVSFANFGDLGFELKSNISHAGKNVAGPSGVSKTSYDVTVTPALYSVTGTSSIDENLQITAFSIVSENVLDFSRNALGETTNVQVNGVDVSAYHIYTDQFNPGRLKTSFSDVLFDFFQQSSQSNNKLEGIFVADRIATRIDSGVTNKDFYKVDQATGQTYEIKKQNVEDNGFGALVMTGTRTGVNQYAKFADTTTNNATIPFSVFLKQELQNNNINHVFELKAPKFQVEYRNATNVTSLPVTRNDNEQTETFTINNTVVESDGTTITGTQTTASFKLADISLNVNFDVSKNYVDYLYNADSKVYSTNMAGQSNRVTATVEYSPNLNPALVNETMVTDVSINTLNQDANGFYILNMSQDVSGLYDTFEEDRYDVCGNLVKTGNNIFVKLPSAYINPTTNDSSYNFDMTPYNGVQTSLIGAEYDISGTAPVIKVRKYTSPMSTPFENLGIDANNVRAVRFQAETVEEAKIELASITFGSTPYNFQTVLNTTATNLTSLPTYSEISKVSISNETIWDNYSSSHLEYVLVPLSFAGVGNILEVTQANATHPVKTLIVNTPDITRIVSADGAPVFRLRSNGRIDTGSVSTARLVATQSRLSSSDKSPAAEFINYNVLLG